jgi:hypothetical protein
MRRSPLITLLLIIISALGLYLILVLTAKRGIGVSADASMYIHMARCLNDLNVCGEYFSKHALVWGMKPPLYPISLAAVHWLGGPDPLEGTRWLNALLFGLNIFLMGRLIHTYTGSAWLSLTGALWMLVKVDVMDIHSMAMSEPLFIFLTLCSAALLLEFLATHSAVLFWGCSLTAALACITRYAGIPLVLTGVGMILLDTKRTLRERLVTALVFLIVSLSPIALWMMGTLKKGYILGREVAFHPLSITQLEGVSWPINPHFDAPGILLFLIAGIGLLGWTIWSKRDPLTLEGMPEQNTRFVHMTLLFIVNYVLFIGVANVLFDARVVDSRYLLPLEILMLLFCLSCVHMLFLSTPGLKISKLFFMGFLFLYLVGTNAEGAVPWAVQRYNDGVGYEGAAWDGSEIIKETKKIPPDRVIYSNNYNALYILAKRESLYIAPKTNTMSLKENLLYSDGIKKLREDLKDKNGLIVYCSSMCKTCGLPTIDELKKKIPLRMLVRVSDGEIYGFRQE